MCTLGGFLISWWLIIIFPALQVVYSSSARELKVETIQPEKTEEDDLDIDAI